MKFVSWIQMYNFLQNEIEMYSPELERYIYLYNDAGAICTYIISKDEAKKLKTLTKAKNLESWSCLLGPGGSILDDENYDRDMQTDLYLWPTYDFCKKYFKYEWIPV